jgi:O-antigen ligase
MQNAGLIKYTELLTYLFLGLAVITSQYSIASSSIGIGGLIILTVFRLIIDRNLKFEYKWIIYLTVFFIFCQFLSAIFASDASVSFNNVLRKIAIYIVFFSAVITINDSKNLQKFIAVFFIFTAVICCIELVRFYIDYISSSSAVPLSEYRLEYFGYPVTNGEIKMLILLLIIPLIASRARFILNKLTLILLSLPLFATYYLTNARNAILGLIAGLIVFGILKNKYFLAGMAVIVVSFLVFAPLSAKERVMSIVDLDHPSNHTRIVIWETGVKMIKDHPVIGIGDVDIMDAYEKYKKPEFHGEGSHMHNNIIHIVLTTGLLGLAVWLWLMIYIFIKQIKIYFRTKQDEFLNLMAVVSICSMIGFQVSGLTEWNFGDAEFAAPLWFMLALGFVALKLYKKIT